MKSAHMNFFKSNYTAQLELKSDATTTFPRKRQISSNQFWRNKFIQYLRSILFEKHIKARWTLLLRSHSSRMRLSNSSSSLDLALARLLSHTAILFKSIFARTQAVNHSININLFLKEMYGWIYKNLDFSILLHFVIKYQPMRKLRENQL